MGKYGKCDFKELEELRKKLVDQQQKIDKFMQECAKELAARLLAKVIKITPVGDYSKEITVTAKRDGKKHKKGEKYTKRVNPSGKVGGKLGRGWTGEKSQNATAYAQSLKIEHIGDVYRIEIVNPVEYAEYVEYGHRTKNHQGWVKGEFMMTISEQEIQTLAPRLLESKIKKLLGECFT